MWYAVPTSWYAHWLAYTGLDGSGTGDGGGQGERPEYVPPLAPRDPPPSPGSDGRVPAPGPVDTRLLLAASGAGRGLCLAAGLVEDADVSFVPAAFWEEVVLKGGYGPERCGAAPVPRVVFSRGEHDAEVRVAGTWAPRIVRIVKY